MGSGSITRSRPHFNGGGDLFCVMVHVSSWVADPGARSWVCAGSNFAPEAHIALYNACAIDGDFTNGRRIMSAMMRLMRVLEQGGKFVQNIKYALTLRGIET